MRRTTPPAIRFWSKVEQPLEFKKCWEWLGVRSRGYGQFRLSVSKQIYAHRFVYEQLVGPIPEGKQIDHLCRNKICMNPFHMEPVTARENTLRSFNLAAINAKKTHCLRGHPLEGDNLDKYTLSKGGRRCRVCATQTKRQYLKRKMLSASYDLGGAMRLSDSERERGL